MQESEQIKHWTALFGVITQRVVIIPYRRFGTTSGPSSGVKKNSWPLRMGPIGCTETSVGSVITRCLIAQNSGVLIYFAAEAWNHLSSSEVWRDKDHFFSFRTSSYHANILTVPCAVVATTCSFQSLPLKSLLPALISLSPSNHLQNRHGLLLRLSFRLLSIVNGALPPNFNSIAELDTLIKAVQQLEDTFSVAYTNFRICLSR